MFQNGLSVCVLILEMALSYECDDYEIPHPRQKQSPSLRPLPGHQDVWRSDGAS